MQLLKQKYLEIKLEDFLFVIFYIIYLYICYKGFIYFLDYIFNFEGINQEILDQQNDYKKKMVYWNKLNHCLYEWRIPNVIENNNKEDSFFSNINEAYWTSTEFRYQWCYISQEELTKFCRELMHSNSFSNEFKCEVFDALIWILINNIENKINCLDNLLLVKHLYYCWKVVNGIN